MTESASIIVQTAPSYGPWLTAGAILLSAIIGASVALYAIGEQRRIARKRATLDMLSRNEWDAAYLESKRKFNELRDSANGLAKWTAEEHWGSAELNVIRNSLNDYELVAVGIKEGILDEELYKRWFESSLTKDWKASEAFIRQVRDLEKSEKFFCEFEWIAKKWIDNP